MSEQQRVLGGIFGRDEQGRAYHELVFRVTALDTDVYNLSWERYLPWCERNATELHHALGITHEQRQSDGAISLLRGLETRYRQPAFLDQIITVRSTIAEVGNSSERFLHQFRRADTVLLDATGTLVWVDGASGQPVRVPDWAREAIATAGQPDPVPDPRPVLGGVFARDEQGRPYHEISFRVTALDTDVFNLSWERYLPWAERNGTELDEAVGMGFAVLKERGLAFFMSGFEVNYYRPAYLGDILTIHSAIERVSAAGIYFRHQFRRGDELLVESYGSLVCVDAASQRATRVPDWMRGAIGVDVERLSLRQHVRFDNLQSGNGSEVLIEGAKWSAEAYGTGRD